MEKRIKIIKFITIIIFITFISLLHPAFSSAASSFDLGVFPPIIEIIAKPKTTVKTKIRLTNFGDPLSLQVNFQPFKSSDQNGNILLTTPDEKDEEALSWFSLTNKNEAGVGQITLKAKENRDLNLILTIPDKAREADHYLTLLFASEPIGNNSLTHSKTSARIGINILLTVSDRTLLPKQGEITEFSAPKFVETGPIPLTLKVKNTGRTFFKPYGTVKIYNTFMKLTGEIAILPQNILGGSTRALTDRSILAQMNEQEEKVLGEKTSQETGVRRQESGKFYDIFFPKLPSSQLLTPNSPIITFPRSFLLGRYTAVAKFTLDEKGPTLTAKTILYAFPVRLFLAILIVVSLLIVIKKRVTR